MLVWSAWRLQWREDGAAGRRWRWLCSLPPALAAASRWQLRAATRRRVRSGRIGRAGACALISGRRRLSRVCHGYWYCSAGVRGADGRACCADVIGKWATNAGKLAELAASFATAHPFPYVVSDDFFAPEVADRIDRRFPVPNGTLPEWQAQVRGRAAHAQMGRLRRPRASALGLASCRDHRVLRVPC